jgi:hypothetical protein
MVGAQVTVTQTEMNFEAVTTTNEEDLYRPLSLRPGPYRVTVVAQGFERLIRDSIDLRVGQTLVIDASLVTGAVRDTIEVTARAALDTETSSSGTTLAGDYLYKLPNYQRHAVAVLLFPPGVTFDSNHYTKSLSGAPRHPLLEDS